MKDNEDKTGASRRAKGSGTIYKKGRIWHARWVVGGKVYRRSTGKERRRDALNVLADLVAPFRAKTEALRIDALRARADASEERARQLVEAQHRLLVASIAEEYRKSTRRRDCAAVTLNRYCAQIDGLVRFLARRFPAVREMRDVTEAHAEAFLRAIRDESPNSYNKRIVLFRNVWKVLGAQAGCETNPWAASRKRRLDTASRRTLTRDELDAVVRAASPEMKTLIGIGLFTGLRLGDAACLEWEAVDTEAGVLRIKPKKTARTSQVVVEIPLIPELVAVLAGAKTAGRKTGFILPGIAERYRKRPVGLSCDIKALFESVGIKTDVESENGRNRRPLVSFHSLRHTFVSLAANAGVPLHLVQAIVGHTNMRMTEYYAHADRATAMREIGRAFAGVGRALGQGSAPIAELPAPDASPALSRVLRAAMALSPEDRAALVSRLAASHA